MNFITKAAQDFIRAFELNDTLTKFANWLRRDIFKGGDKQIVKANGDYYTFTTGVTPGSYTVVSLTVNEFGQITSISSGTAGGGTVTSVSVVTANGVSGVVATPTTTPSITLTLGAITPTSVNGIIFSGTGTVTNTGTSGLSSFTGSGTSSGINTGDQSFTASGDATAPSSSSTIVLTLATVNGNVGSFGGTLKTVSLTANAKGLITAASEAIESIALLSTVDQSTTSTTPVNVTNGSFSIGANETWYVNLLFRVGTSANNGMRMDVTVPSGCTLHLINIGSNTATTNIGTQWLQTSGTTALTLNSFVTTVGYIRLQGYIINGSTAGTVQVRFNTQNVANTVTLYANSGGVVKRIA